MFMPKVSFRMASASRESDFGVQTSTARKNHRSGHTEGAAQRRLARSSASALAHTDPGACRLWLRGTVVVVGVQTSRRKRAALRTGALARFPPQPSATRRDPYLTGVGGRSENARAAV